MKLFLSLFLFIISICFTIFYVQKFNLSLQSIYFDAPSLALVIIITLSFIISGSFEITKLLNRAFFGTLISGLLGFLIGIIFIFGKMYGNPIETVGPAYSVALLPIFYSLILGSIFKIIIYFFEDNDQ